MLPHPSAPDVTPPLVQRTRSQKRAERNPRHPITDPYSFGAELRQRVRERFDGDLKAASCACGFSGTSTLYRYIFARASKPGVEAPEPVRQSIARYISSATIARIAEGLFDGDTDAVQALLISDGVRERAVAYRRLIGRDLTAAQAALVGRWCDEHPRVIDAIFDLVDQRGHPDEEATEAVRWLVAPFARSGVAGEVGRAWDDLSAPEKLAYFDHGIGILRVLLNRPPALDVLAVRQLDTVEHALSGVLAGAYVPAERDPVSEQPRRGRPRKPRS